MTAATRGVSVIVPTFNRAHYLRAALDSLLAQTVPPLEVIVVDDGSDDTTPDVAATYGDRIVYRRKDNGGKSRAVAVGLGIARGDWIWIFDDDDVAVPTAIEMRLAVAAGNQDAGFVYAPHHLGVDGPDGAGAPIRITGTHDPGKVPSELFLLEIMRGCFFHLNSCLVRRSLFDSLHGFDVQLLRGQDYDFQIRLARIATPAYCPEPAFVFRQHGGARGPASIRHSSEDRRAQFLRFSRAIGVKIRQQSALADYCVPPAQHEPDGDDRILALLHRMQVMANHGCIEEMFVDLREALACVARRPDRRLRPAEGKLLRRAICIGLADDAAAADWQAFQREAQALRTLSGGAQALRWLARGRFAMARGFPGTGAQRLERLRHSAWLAWRSLA